MIYSVGWVVHVQYHTQPIHGGTSLAAGGGGGGTTRGGASTAVASLTRMSN